MLTCRKGKGEAVPVTNIPLSIDIPFIWNGTIVDPCATEISAPGCTYDLALTALTSQLVTYAPYTVAGVTFEPPNGTLGLPYYAMEHFSKEVASSPFEEEYRQYCLPVLDPHIITCTEEPFDQLLGETNSSLVQYKSLHVSETINSTGVPIHQAPITDAGMFKIIIDYPSDEPSNIKYRTDDEGQGTMVTKHHPDPNHLNVSIIATTNSGTDGYASLMHEMMYGVKPDLSGVPPGYSLFFVAKCEYVSIKYRDNLLSSWRQVDFTLRNGVLRANVTKERCPNARGAWTSGFADLDYFLEGAGAVLSSSDGYSKLFNRNTDLGIGELTGSPLFRNMSRLDAVMNQIYHIIQTSWAQSAYEYALLNQTLQDQPIIMTTYPHLYVIRISWTPTTYIGVVLSLLITLNAWLLAARWLRATYRFGFDAETWNLLRPIDLMAYSLGAYPDLIPHLNTPEHRRMTMHGSTRLVLREQPVWQGLQSHVGLLSMQDTISASNARSPLNILGSKNENPVGGSGVRAGVTVTEKNEDVERQNRDSRPKSENFCDAK